MNFPIECKRMASASVYMYCEALKKAVIGLIPSFLQSFKGSQVNMPSYRISPANTKSWDGT